eukprot:TRINITY_DN541_c0_g1_i5.p1 TRINITY_DN541_c0_g1~~TRINITY_DN541_c0_g1_i5.p1  ORF type:complete len:612 (-),score=124.33 TRINITY_DN541_c0_g1_i5:354-2189(-)
MSTEIFQDLEAVQRKLIDVLEEYRKNVSKAQEEFNTNMKPILQQRFDLISGSRLPTEEELEGWNKKLPSNEEANQEEQQPLAPTGIKYFWLNVLISDDLISEQITNKDELVLSYLKDVRVWESAEGKGVEFHFDTNPFFGNKVLRRSIQYTGNDIMSFVGYSEDQTEITWKAGKNVTVREVATKKGKKGKKGNQAQEKAKLKGCPSFFRFFMPAKIVAEDITQEQDEEEEVMDDERQLDKAQLDLDIIQRLLHRVIPKAANIFGADGEIIIKVADQTKQNDEDYDDDNDEQTIFGSVEELPLQAQAALFAVQNLKLKIEDVTLSSRKRRVEYAREMESKMAEIFKERKKLLVDEKDEQRIPHFWAIAMKGADVVHRTVHARDMRVLKYLIDVRRVRQFPMPEENKGKTVLLEFEFSDNPFFTNKVLQKKYVYEVAESLDVDPAIEKTEESKVEWKADMDITCKVDPQNPKQKKNVASFFQLFKPQMLKYLFGVYGEGKDAIQEAKALELEFLQELVGPLMVFPLSYYKSMVDYIADEEFEVEGDDEDEDEYGDEEEDEDEDTDKKDIGSKIAKARGKKSKSGPNKGTIILICLGLVLLAQGFYFLAQMNWL